MLSGLGVGRQVHRAKCCGYFPLITKLMWPAEAGTQRRDVTEVKATLTRGASAPASTLGKTRIHRLR